MASLWVSIQFRKVVLGPLDGEGVGGAWQACIEIRSFGFAYTVWRY